MYQLSYFNFYVVIMFYSQNFKITSNQSLTLLEFCLSC